MHNWRIQHSEHVGRLSRGTQKVDASNSTLLRRTSSAPLKFESGDEWGTFLSSTKKTCHFARSSPGSLIRGDSALKSEPPERTSVKAPLSCSRNKHLPPNTMRQVSARPCVGVSKNRRHCKLAILLCTAVSRWVQCVHLDCSC